MPFNNDPRIPSTKLGCDRDFQSSSRLPILHQDRGCGPGIGEDPPEPPRPLARPGVRVAEAGSAPTFPNEPNRQGRSQVDPPPRNDPDPTTGSGAGLSGKTNPIAPARRISGWAGDPQGKTNPIGGFVVGQDRGRGVSRGFRGGGSSERHSPRSEAVPGTNEANREARRLRGGDLARIYSPDRGEANPGPSRRAADLEGWEDRS